MLIQEQYGPDLWKILVCCVMLNRSKGEQVRPVAEKFFARWASPQDVESWHLDDMVEVLRPLGLEHRKAIYIISIAAGLVNGDDYETLLGVGQYAKDSVQIFYHHDYDFEPEDVVLKSYLEERRREA